MNKFVIKVVSFSLFVTFLAVPSVSFGATNKVTGCKAGYKFSPITGKPCKVVKPVQTLKQKPVFKPLKFNNCSGIACTSATNA